MATNISVPARRAGFPVTWLIALVLAMALGVTAALTFSVANQGTGTTGASAQATTYQTRPHGGVAGGPSEAAAEADGPIEVGGYVCHQCGRP
jgi:hypothetical protein